MNVMKAYDKIIRFRFSRADIFLFEVFCHIHLFSSNKKNEKCTYDFELLSEVFNRTRCTFVQGDNALFFYSCLFSVISYCNCFIYII